MAAVTVANVSSKAIVNFCASKGVASDRLLSAAGIPQNLIDEPGAKIAVLREDERILCCLIDQSVLILRIDRRNSDAVNTLGDEVIDDAFLLRSGTV